LADSAVDNLIEKLKNIENDLTDFSKSHGLPDASFKCDLGPLINAKQEQIIGGALLEFTFEIRAESGISKKLTFSLVSKEWENKCTELTANLKISAKK